MLLAMMGGSSSNIENAETAADSVLSEHQLKEILSVLTIYFDVGEKGLASKYNDYFSYSSIVLRSTL